jgi:hypothetical protein
MSKDKEFSQAVAAYEAARLSAFRSNGEAEALTFRNARKNLIDCVVDDADLIARALRTVEILDKTIDGPYDGDCGVRGDLVDALEDSRENHWTTGEGRTPCDDVTSVLDAFREAVK